MGRGQQDKITAKKKSESIHFSSLCYSADGSSILAGGNSKYICIYNVQGRLLYKEILNQKLIGVGSCQNHL